MIKYVAESDYSPKDIAYKGRIIIQGKDELDSVIRKYGLFTYKNIPIRYTVFDRNYDNVREMKSYSGDIVIVTSMDSLNKLGYIIDSSYFEVSKFKLMLQELELNGILYENKKVLSTLFKLISGDMREFLLKLADGCDNYITMDYLMKNYNIDNLKHPVQVLKSILGNKGCKSVLKKCRETYTDSGIMTVFRQYLKSSIDNRKSKLLMRSVKYDPLYKIDFRNIYTFYYALCTTNNIDLAINIYKKELKVKFLY